MTDEDFKTLELVCLRNVERSARMVLKYGSEQKHETRTWTVYPSQGDALYAALRDLDVLRSRYKHGQGNE